VLNNDLCGLAIEKSIAAAILREEQLKPFIGTYKVFAGTVSHRMRITLEGATLFAEALNPGDRLPKVALYAEKENKFHMKEAPLKFEFVKEGAAGIYKLVTYNNSGKDIEWKKL
jgi:hypothetical protein